MISKPANNQLLMEGTASISPQEPSISAHPSQKQEDQLFQILHEMREQIKKQQSNHELEQMTLNHDNILREQEELKLLNQLIQTQVGALQNNSARTKGDPESGSPQISMPSMN